MNMTPEQTEKLHQDILKVLDLNATRFGLGCAGLGVMLLPFGWDLKVGDLEPVMDYLSDPEVNLVAQVSKGQVNPALRTWKLTARGTNYLRERGL